MKKKVLGFAAVALAGLLTLTACTSPDQTADQPSGAASGSQDIGGSTSDQAQTPQGTQAVSGTTVGTDGGASSGNGGADQGTGSVPTDSAAQDTADADPAVPEGNAPESTEEPDVGETADIWSGTYIGEEETVSLGKKDEETVSFSFAQAGISGTAQIQGSQAVFHGDDYHVIVFNIHDTILDVSVSSEEDFDTQDSPLIGTYVKEG